MKMGFRWYGEGNDSVSLKQIKQIPGVETIVWTLHDMQAGEEWPIAKILEVKKQAEQYGFNSHGQYLDYPALLPIKRTLDEY